MTIYKPSAKFPVLDPFDGSGEPIELTQHFHVSHSASAHILSLQSGGPDVVLNAVRLVEPTTVQGVSFLKEGASNNVKGSAGLSRYSEYIQKGQVELPPGTLLVAEFNRRVGVGARAFYALRPAEQEAAQLKRVEIYEAKGNGHSAGEIKGKGVSGGIDDLAAGLRQWEDEDQRVAHINDLQLMHQLGLLKIEDADAESLRFLNLG